MTKLFSKHPNRSPLSLDRRPRAEHSPSPLGRVGVGLSPSLLGRVGVGLLLFTLCACGGGKSKEAKSAAELIADADHFQVDTIVATPDDTLVSTSVDHVLRHYPELYRAAEKAQKIYSKWALQEQQTQLKTQPSLLDIRSILTDLFSASQQPNTLPLPTGEGRGGALLLDSIDAAYLHLISEAPAERKTDIGHSRKAFLAYAERLQQLMQALPEDLRERYSSIVARRLQRLLQEQQKSIIDN